MNQKGPHTPPGTKDRKLGDEWLDWDGSTGHGATGVDEKARTFLLLAALSLLLLFLSLFLGWYLAKPRLDQAGPLVSQIVGAFLLVFSLLFLLLLSVETLLVFGFSKSLFPYGASERLLLALLPKGMWLGKKMGIHRDRIGSSFIKTHNLLVRSHAKEIRPDPLLVLLPRCLKKEARQEVTDRVNGTAARIVTVAGGEEARKAIMEYRPSLILAVACERDLLSGIRDVAEKVHVLAIPNERPEGPCKNTGICPDALEKALEFIKGRGNTDR